MLYVSGGAPLASVVSGGNLMRSWTTIPILLLSMGLVVAGDSRADGEKPAQGFVPDAKTAIKIAVAVWEPIYGEKQIAKEKPYRAKLLTNAVWKVEGSLPEGWNGG